MNITETYKIKILTFVRIKFDSGAQDGIIIENEKDSKYVTVYFPLSEILETISRDQIYKIGKTIELDFNESGLWD